MEEKSLHINGYNNRHIHNHFYTHSNSNKKLAIMFPGINYTNDKPLLFYTKHLFLQYGYDVLDIEFDYLKNKEFLFLSNYRKEIIFEDDIEGILKVLVSMTMYTEVIFNVKSIGSKAMVQIHNRLPFHNIKIIWHTPLLRDDHVFKEMFLCKYQSLAIIGNRDTHYDPHIIRKLLKNENYNFFEVENLDHSYMNEKSVLESIKKSKSIIQRIEDFICM